MRSCSYIFEKMKRSPSSFRVQSSCKQMRLLSCLSLILFVFSDRQLTESPLFDQDLHLHCSVTAEKKTFTSLHEVQAQEEQEYLSVFRSRSI